MGMTDKIPFALPSGYRIPVNRVNCVFFPNCTSTVPATGPRICERCGAGAHRLFTEIDRDNCNTGPKEATR